MKRSSLSVCLALGVLAVGAAAAHADRGQTYLGRTVAGSPQFLRTTEAGAATGTSVRYQVQTFEVSEAGICFIYGQQDYDGWLSLYRTSFSPGSPTVNFVAADDDGDLGISTSQISNINLTVGHYILVNSAFGSGFGNFTTSIHCESETSPLALPCNNYVIGSGIPNSAGVCLNNRFLVWIDNVSASTTGGLGTPVPFASNDTGLFWFYSPTNIEAVVKVLNGCGTNTRWWVFAAALTNQTYRIRVFDTVHPEAGIRDYTNFFPTSSPAFTDTNAFATCP